METNSEPKETGSHSFANSIISAGVTIGASNVEIVVTATESAVLPFAKTS